MFCVHFAGLLDVTQWLPKDLAKGGARLHHLPFCADARVLSALALSRAALPRNLTLMFTIEHDFDATVVTLLDAPAAHRQEDITITAFEDCVVIEQDDPRVGSVQKVTLSLSQLADLTAALNLPEGVYTREKP